MERGFPTPKPLGYYGLYSNFTYVKVPTRNGSGIELVESGTFFYQCLADSPIFKRSHRDRSLIPILHIDATNMIYVSIPKYV